MPMHNPPHPGEIIREDCLKPLGLTITEAADGLGIHRKNLSRILNGHAGVSPDMAVRLSNAFGSTPEMWLKLQMAYDLGQARQKDENQRVRKFAPA
jgi:addiction module HigA family antidote